LIKSVSTTTFYNFYSIYLPYSCSYNVVIRSYINNDFLGDKYLSISLSHAIIFIFLINSLLFYNLYANPVYIFNPHNRPTFSYAVKPNPVI